ncbi:MAG: hypothetical protein JNN27_08380 [Planctomycetes bacterium]|nr:hypothetical protein [Planctomycetota bacterium]
MNARKRANELDEQLERELGAWIGAQRSEPAAFRAGVERRIAEAERARAARGDGGEQNARAGAAAEARGVRRESGARATLRSGAALEDVAASDAGDPPSWVRKAAAWLPPDSSALLLSSGKGWSAALLLPLLVFGAAFSVFFAGLRSIDRSVREAAPTPAKRPGDLPNIAAQSGPGRFVAWAQLVVPLSGVAIVFAPLFGAGRWVVDVLIAVISVAMLSLAVQVRGLARAGLLERRFVAQVCVGALMHLLCGCFLWIQSLRIEAPYSITATITGLVGVLGAMLLIVWQRRSIPLYGLVLATLVLPVFLSTPLATDADERLREFVRETKLHANELRHWGAFDAAVATLRACNEPAPDFEKLRAEVQDAIEREVDAHPAVWTAAARLGLVTDEQWRQLSTRKLESFRLAQLLSRTEPLHLHDYDEYQVHMLLATRALSAEERLHLVERVDRSWPAPEAQLTLEPTLACVRWLDLLGHGERVDARREQLQALLLRHWVDPEHVSYFGGGFADLPETNPNSSASPTYAAVQLMVRVGVPRGLDVGLLHDYLRRETRRTLLVSPRWVALRALDHAALLRVERQVGLPELSWFQRLIAERALLAVALILALCVYAIRSAPERDPFALAAGAPR